MTAELHSVFVLGRYQFRILAVLRAILPKLTRDSLGSLYFLQISHDRIPPNLYLLIMRCHFTISFCAVETTSINIVVIDISILVTHKDVVTVASYRISCHIFHGLLVQTSALVT